MIIKRTNNELSVITDQERKSFYSDNPFEIRKGINGKNYVTLSSVPDCFLNVSEGNSKTGEKCINFNFSIESTCDHNCECYKDGICYAESGCYLFSDNQAKYSENIKFFKNTDNETFCKAVQIAIDNYKYNLFRFFTCGDIPNKRFIDCMVKIAKDNPGIKFWSYTKKYNIVNNWIDENGLLPDNLVIIFSHWMNKDGTYFEMNNKHNLPTSEFIPFGKEHLAEIVTHICPCSDPSIKATCATCDHPCYKLNKGESMALLEHSTKQTKERDKTIKAAKAAL